MLEPAAELWVWRHPRAQGAAGRCIGRTDLGIDPRRAKRLAHRILRTARQCGLPRRVLTSPLRRCAAVGQWLRRWGWRHERLPALLEMDFGRWDGRAWSQVAREEVDAWCVEFLHHRPGGGETLHELFARVAAWQAPAAPVVIVAHAGWMLARRWLASAQPLPVGADQW
ncbi:MAG TPA: histidine phosphatase family protein, partial [Burkholderiaceae bacterium]